MSEIKKGRGGARKGAGRPKGSVKRISDLLDEKRTAILNAGDPADFLVEVMRNQNILLGVRIRAAVEVLPYLKPKLQQVENIGASTVKHEYTMSDNEFARRIALILTGKAKG
jgi:hypothetical protein